MRCRAVDDGSLGVDRIASLADGLIYLRVIVTDRSGKQVVDGLRQRHFRVSERGQVRPIEYFSAQPGPVTLTVILDFSGSMIWPDKLEPEPAIRISAAECNDVAELSILTFAGSLHLAKSFENPEIQLPAEGLAVRLQDMDGKLWTSVTDALLVAAENLCNSAKHGKWLVILFSDGQDNASRYSCEELAERFKRCGARLNILTPDHPLSEPEPVLKEIGRETGGSILFAKGIDAATLSGGIRWFLEEQ